MKVIVIFLDLKKKKKNTLQYIAFEKQRVLYKQLKFCLDSADAKVASHFVPRSFRTYFSVISYPVTTISYLGHFVPNLVISYLGQLGTKWLYGGRFVLKSFRTLFGHFVPILVISYPAKMDGWVDWRTDGQACFDWNDKLTSYF